MTRIKNALAKIKTPTSFAEPNRGNKNGSVEDNTIQSASYKNTCSKTTSSSPCLEAALKYSELGWPVFPCYTIVDGKCSCGAKDCNSPGKHPRTSNGLKDASTDPDVIKNWWNKCPDANIAVVTGPTSGLAVLDIDIKSGGPGSLDLLESEYGSIPDTLVAQTGGGGRHYFFKYPAVGFKNSANKIASGIDTRGNGGYVLVAPSNHKSGETYNWQDYAPREIELAEVPEWVLQKLADKKKKITSGKVSEGGRNEFLTSEAGKLRRPGLTAEAICAALLLINKDKCNPPLVDSEVKAIADSVSRYKPGHSPSIPYKQSEDGITWLKPSKDGCNEVPLTNFTARISSEVQKDDGGEVLRYFEMETTINGHTNTFPVSASEFPGLNWVTREMGAKAIVLPGFATKDHTRVAIQLLSKDIQSHTIYTHLGWRNIDGCWFFLHSGGAIGPVGSVVGIQVDPGQQRLKDYKLPNPPDQEKLEQIIQCVLALLELTHDRIIIPLIASAFRSILSEVLPVDFSVFVVGPTGCQKSEITGIVQSFFGSGFNGKTLPGNWSATANSLERMSFLAKDCIFTVDDFAPSGSPHDVSRLHREADRLFRGQGNRAGRSRMRSDGSLRAENYPRGMIVSSGEDIPKGQSLRARTVIIELTNGDIDLDILTQAQKDSAAGIFSQSVSGYIQWIASQVDSLKVSLIDRKQELREQARQSEFAHDRTPDIVASLIIGWESFLDYALFGKAINESMKKELFDRGRDAITETSKAQASHQLNEEPAARFLELLSAAIAGGHGHLCHIDGNREPDTFPSKWGWRNISSNDGQCPRMQPQGDKIGWVECDDIYLEPDSAYAAIQKLVKSQGSSFPVTQSTLWKRLDEKGHLASKELGRLRIRVQVDGSRRSVIHLNTGSLSVK